MNKAFFDELKSILLRKKPLQKDTVDTSSSKRADKTHLPLDGSSGSTALTNSVSDANYGPSGIS